MTSPKVTFVIPTYNCADYIGEALESALAQTYRPLEVVVVDDGSTDQTQRIVREFGAKVNYIRQDNRGIAAARNTGIRAASGDFIALLDADDTCSPERVRKQLAAFRCDAKIRLVASDCALTDSTGQPTGDAWTLQDSLGVERLRHLSAAKCCDGQAVVLTEEAFVSYLRKSLFADATVLLKKRIFNQVGRYDETFDRAGGYDLMIRMLRVCRMAHVCEPLYFYRKGIEGALTGNRRRMCAGVIRALEKVEKTSAWNRPEVRHAANEHIAGKHVILAAYAVRSGDTRRARCHLLEAARRCPRPVPLGGLAATYAGPLGMLMQKAFADRVLRDERNEQVSRQDLHAGDQHGSQQHLRH